MGSFRQKEQPAEKAEGRTDRTSTGGSNAPGAKVSTRDRMILEGEHLFAVYGYQSTTTRMIGDSLGINNAAVYNHFGTKENFYKEVLDAVAQKMEATYAPLTEEIEQARAKGPLLPVKAWYFVERFVDLMISVVRDPERKDAIYLLVHEEINPTDEGRPITRIACMKGEELLASLLMEYWDLESAHSARVASRLAVGSLISLGEHPSFLRLALNLPDTAELPEDVWDSVRRYTLSALRNFTPINEENLADTQATLPDAS